jgi:ATP-dependent RNA helicase RhlB
MTKPAEIVIEPEHVTVDLVTQELYHVGSHEKFRLLLGILGREKPRSAIVFCNQKNTAEEVSRRLGMNGIECDFIMGDLPQSKRLSIIDNLKAGTLEILVATDVAARGLDIEGLDLVINYDVPNETETYVHRIGRTARAGKSGKAVTLACERYVYGLPAIESLIGMRIPVFTFGDELMPEDKSSRVNYRHSHDRGTSASSRRTPGHDGRRNERPSHGLPRPAPKSARPSAPSQMPRTPADAHPEEPNRRPVREQTPRRQETGTTRRRDAPAVPASSEGTPNPYSMSQEERMRHYRERYGGSAAPGQSKETTDTRGRASAPAAEHTSARGDAPGSPKGPQTGSQPAPKGFWARLKALFGGRPKSGE